MMMNVEGFNEAWSKVFDLIIDAGIADEFASAVMKSAEIASRMAAASYSDERTHLRESVKAEFCYGMNDALLRAREESRSQAKIKEAERIREELFGS
ncbi:MAG: hypothetical protein IJV91_11105 [Kiritimatiellae bacterium]|nr:hypothetical protein [Kiritimatiellia bacterium]